MSKSIRHFMRLGMHAEQNFFESYRDNIDTVILNANLVNYFSRATATLMSGKLVGKNYIIDPMTHAFGHNPKFIMTEETVDKPGKIKPSIADLAEIYGAPITTAILNKRPRAVTPDDFKSKQIDALSTNVIGFQSNYLENAIDDSERKYLPEDGTQTLKPEFLIAPYFYMKLDTIKDWLEINQKLVLASKTIASKENVYAEIVVDRGILDNKEAINEIAAAYLEIDAACDGYLLWVSDLSEHEASVSTLFGLRLLVSELAKNGKPVVNIYGGYFSLLLTEFGMTGVCHGPGYGENRDVIPVGGGMPVSKFYLTPVHQRLMYRDVQFILRDPSWNIKAYYKEICAGPECKEILSGDLANFRIYGEETVAEKKGKSYSYPTYESRTHTTRHYLEAKIIEYDDVVKKEKKALIEQLIQAKKRFDPLMPGARLRHLDAWIETIKRD